MSEPALVGRRVLVVEDEYFLADELDRALTSAGAVVVGPAPSINSALDMLQQEDAPEIAVLDVNLGGDYAYRVADALCERGIPFVFTTGYDQASIPERYADAPRLEKPVETRIILQELGRLLGSVNVIEKQTP